MSIPPWPRLVVVDDTDSDIIYSNSSSAIEDWYSDGSKDDFANFGAPYQHTLHATQNNASFSYSFNGTNIYVYGTVQVKNNSGVLQPSWECFIDGISTGTKNNQNLPGAENNWVLCQILQAVAPFVDGQHEILVNVTTDGTPFWFDDIKYQPSPNALLDTSTILIDNSDPSIQYQGWAPLGGTATFTQVHGATMALNFTGISLSWYSFGPGPPFSSNSTIATYSIDGGTLATFTVAKFTTFNQLIFTTPELPPGPHSLIVTHGGNISYTPLCLDYLIVNNATHSTTTGNTSSSPATPSTSHSTPPTPSSPPNIGAIVGEVIAALISIGVIVGIFVWRRRNRPVQHILPFLDYEEGSLHPRTSSSDIRRSVPDSHKVAYKPAPPEFGYPRSDPSSKATIQSTSRVTRSTSISVENVSIQSRQERGERGGDLWAGSNSPLDF